MSEAAPLSWLFEQNVPLIFFIIALLTRPATWAKKARSLLNNYLGKAE